jgi:hypothetical protein
MEVVLEVVLEGVVLATRVRRTLILRNARNALN